METDNRPKVKGLAESPCRELACGGDPEMGWTIYVSEFNCRQVMVLAERWGFGPLGLGSWGSGPAGLGLTVHAVSRFRTAVLVGQLVVHGLKHGCLNMYARVVGNYFLTRNGRDPIPLHMRQSGDRKVASNLYESFVSARDREERGLTEKREGRPDKPRQGNTIFVSGHKITEEFLRKAFHSCGHIVNVTMEIEKHRGFVTFDKVEVADRAITELKVSLARRQPVIQPINDASSSSTWSTLAASHSQKGSHKDKREPVVYDEDLFS
ncbi:unnamed protein product [Timema podura]|uniref:Negative elongation factor E n=1 Tax=Timema podura TaxID=61482 RepID=A0ABN7NX48_TIMPD|nr:unnamed protein product [Timema podura]